MTSASVPLNVGVAAGILFFLTFSDKSSFNEIKCLSRLTILDTSLFTLIFTPSKFTVTVRIRQYSYDM